MLKQQGIVTYLKQGGEKQEHGEVGEEADQLCEDVPARQGVPAKHVEKPCREEVPAKQADQLQVQVEQEEQGDKEQQHRDVPLAVGEADQHCDVVPGDARSEEVPAKQASQHHAPGKKDEVKKSRREEVPAKKGDQPSEGDEAVPAKEDAPRKAGLMSWLVSAGEVGRKGNLRFQGVPAKKSRREEVPTKEGDQPSEQRKLSQSGCDQITAAADQVGGDEAVPAKDGGQGECGGTGPLARLPAQQLLAPEQEESPGWLSIPPKPKGSSEILGGGTGGGGRADHETQLGSNAPHKAGLLSWLVSAGKGDEKGNLVRRERNNCGSPPPHKAKVGGLLGGRRTVAGSKPPKSLQQERGKLQRRD